MQFIFFFLTIYVNIIIRTLEEDRDSYSLLDSLFYLPSLRYGDESFYCWHDTSLSEKLSRICFERIEFIPSDETEKSEIDITSISCVRERQDVWSYVWNYMESRCRCLLIISLLCNARREIFHPFRMKIDLVRPIFLCDSKLRYLMTMHYVT